MRFKNITAALLMVFTINLITFAQEKDQEVHLNSPRQTIYTHLKLLQPNNYHPELAGKTLNISNPAKAAKLAVKLKQFLDAKGLEVEINAIPNNPNHTDTATGIHKFILFEKYPQIFVEKINGAWLYSEKTVNAIPDLHDEVFPFGSDWLVGLFPKVGHKEFLGLQLWQYMGIFLIILISIILHKVLTIIISHKIKIAARKRELPETQIELIHKVSRPLSLLIITLILLILVPMLQLPVTANKYIMMIINALTPLFGTLFFYRLVDLLAIYFEKLAAKTESTLDDQLIPLLKKTLKLFILVSGGIIVLQTLDFDITAILAGVSIGGLALALAAQDTLKNLFGSVMIFVDRPFQIGDWISFDGNDGTVEEVGFRSTRVRTFANSLISVPNAKISDMVVDNMGLRVYRRFKTNIALTYDTPPDLIEQFVEGLREIVINHPSTRKDYFEIHLNAMGSSSLDILFYIFFSVANWSEELKARHEVLLAIIRLAEELGINFAFPTQTLHVENLPGQESLSPTYVTDKGKMKEKLAVFMEKYRSQFNN